MKNKFGYVKENKKKILYMVLQWFFLSIILGTIPILLVNDGWNVLAETVKAGMLSITLSVIGIYALLQFAVGAYPAFAVLLIVYLIKYGYDLTIGNTRKKKWKHYFIRIKYSYAPIMKLILIIMGPLLIISSLAVLLMYNNAIYDIAMILFAIYILLYAVECIFLRRRNNMLFVTSTSFIEKTGYVTMKMDYSEKRRIEKSMKKVTLERVSHCEMAKTIGKIPNEMIDGLKPGTYRCITHNTVISQLKKSSKITDVIVSKPISKINLGKMQRKFTLEKCEGCKYRGKPCAIQKENIAKERKELFYAVSFRKL